MSEMQSTIAVVPSSVALQAVRMSTRYPLLSNLEDWFQTVLEAFPRLQAGGSWFQITIAHVRDSSRLTVQGLPLDT